MSDTQNNAIYLDHIYICQSCYADDAIFERIYLSDICKCIPYLNNTGGFKLACMQLHTLKASELFIHVDFVSFFVCNSYVAPTFSSEGNKEVFDSLQQSNLFTRCFR